MTNLKTILTWLCTSYFGLMTLGTILFLVGFLPMSWIDEDTIIGQAFIWTGVIGTGLLFVMTIYGMAYAWIINPIRNYTGSSPFVLFLKKLFVL